MKNTRQGKTTHTPQNQLKYLAPGRLKNSAITNPQSSMIGPDPTMLSISICAEIVPMIKSAIAKRCSQMNALLGAPFCTSGGAAVSNVVTA